MPASPLAELPTVLEKDMVGRLSAKGDKGFMLRTVRSATGTGHWLLLGNANGCFDDVLNASGESDHPRYAG